MKRSNYGFTLIELLIAIAIFASLSLVSYQVLQGTITSNKIATSHIKQLKSLQKAILIIERDFEQITNRNARDKKGANSNSFAAGKESFLASQYHAISFIRLGWSNSTERSRSNLQRVAYLVQDNKLLRRYFLYPDPVVGELPEEEIILSGVTDFVLRYFKAGEWYNTWQQNVNNSNNLPEGIGVSIELENIGKLERLFIIPKK